MALIHNTTMSPGKLELLAAWLPAQPWYCETGHKPELARAGGFRLDDPEGEVGIEFTVVTDGSRDGATTLPGATDLPSTFESSSVKALRLFRITPRMADALVAADSSSGLSGG